MLLCLPPLLCWSCAGNHANTTHDLHPMHARTQVVSVAQKLVPMTITLWNRTQVKMLPTPAKFHYLFNMRELSKVFQGVILASRDRFRKGASQPYGGNVTAPEAYLLALWLHECRRVFSDKLVSYDDKGWVDKQLQELMRDNVSADVVRQVRRAANASCAQLPVFESSWASHPWCAHRLWCVLQDVQDFWCC
jgi:hypothetical protein